MKNKFFSRETLAGYNRQLLQESCVLVVGAGALGQNVIQNLALSGIGEIRVIDKDEFEDHNRTRSPAYPTAEEQVKWGMSKAKAVAHKLRPMMSATNPTLRYAHAWIQELGDLAFRDVDVVVSCVDNPRARAYLANQTRWFGIAFVEAGFEGPSISMSCFPPTTTTEEAESAPCWCCSHQELTGTFSCREYARRAESEGIVPAIQNGAATLAGLQSEATIQILHQNPQFPYKALDLDVQTGRSRIVELGTDPKCTPGIHSMLTQSPTLTDIRADMTLANIFDLLSKYVSGTPIIKRHEYFEGQFVWEHAGQKIAKPTWAFASQVNTKIEDSKPPILYSELAPYMRSEILDMRGFEIGLLPGSILEVYDEETQNSPFIYFQMQGRPHEIFTIIE